MRLLILAFVLVVLGAGCGQAGGGPAGEPEPTGVTLDREEGDLAEGGIRPPGIVLESAAGRQAGVRGSYCVTNDAAGEGMCADAARPPQAKRANVVRPGEEITFALEGARAVKADGCGSRDTSCIGEARIAPAGCKAVTAARVFLERGVETRWQARLEPGAYEVQLFVYFETDDGSIGDLSAAFGLLVDESVEQTIVPMPAAAAICP
jgi:hypothetical protein